MNCYIYLSILNYCKYIYIELLYIKVYCIFTYLNIFDYIYLYWFVSYINLIVIYKYIGLCINILICFIHNTVFRPIWTHQCGSIHQILILQLVWLEPWILGLWIKHANHCSIKPWWLSNQIGTREFNQLIKSWELLICYM